MSTPSGHRVRAFRTTADDHSGVALVITTLLMTWSILCCSIRLYTRKMISNWFGLDDLFCVFATISGVVQAIISCTSIYHGFGKSMWFLSKSQSDYIEKSLFAADLLYILTLCLAKCSMALFFARITCINKQKIGCYILLAFIVCNGLVSFIVEGTRCGSLRPWKSVGESCTHFIPGWRALTGLDVLSEILIFSMPVWLVFGVQMRGRTKRIVVFAFLLRLPVVAPAITRLHYLNVAQNSTNPGIAGVLAFICEQVEMNFGNMAMTIPCLQPFIKTFNTGWGTFDTRGIGGYTSYPLSNLDSNVSRSRPKPGSLQPPITGAQRSSTRITGHSLLHKQKDEVSRCSGQSDRSQKQFIRKTVDTDVEYLHSDARAELDSLGSGSEFVNPYDHGR